MIIQLRWNRDIAPGRARREFKPLTRFQIEKILNFENCLEPSFKAFELLILPCYFLSNFPKYWYNFASKDYPWLQPLSRINHGTALWNIRHFKYFQETFALASRALIIFISEVISQTEMLRHCSEDALSTDRRMLCSYSKLAQFAGMNLLTMIVMTWGDQDITLIRKSLKDVLISTTPGHKLQSTWCLRRISSKRTNTLIVYILLQISHS